MRNEHFGISLVEAMAAGTAAAPFFCSLCCSQDIDDSKIVVLRRTILEFNATTIFRVMPSVQEP